MTSNTERKLKQWSLAIGIMVIIVPLFVSAVQKDGMIQQNKLAVDDMRTQIYNEQQERKASDVDIRNELVRSEKQTQIQLSQIQLDLAVLNTNMQYLVKEYDKKKESY